MKPVAFMFAGQGAQTVGMGADLAQESPAAKAIFDRADRALGRSISALCFEGPSEELTLSTNCQPAIYTMSVACLEAFRERCDVTPLACGGLSLGEFAALTAAGALDFDAGLRLVAERGALMDAACRASDGVMAAVLKASDDVVAETAARHDIDVANYNCPGQLVISGERAKVEACVADLSENSSARVIMLQVDGAFHSRLMQPAADGFSAALEGAAFSSPSCPVAQNVVGDLVSDPSEFSTNLARQITGSVRWESCVRSMLDLGAEALIEFGPGQVLTGFMRRIDRAIPCANVSDMSGIETAVSAVCDA